MQREFRFPPEIHGGAVVVCAPISALKFRGITSAVQQSHTAELVAAKGIAQLQVVGRIEEQTKLKALQAMLVSVNGNELVGLDKDKWFNSLSMQGFKLMESIWENLHEIGASDVEYLFAEKKDDKEPSLELEGLPGND